MVIVTDPVRVGNGRAKMLSRENAGGTYPREKPGEGEVQQRPGGGGEPKGEEKDMTIVFGRFNPPTVGHKLVLDKSSFSLEIM